MVHSLIRSFLAALLLVTVAAAQPEAQLAPGAKLLVVTTERSSGAFRALEGALRARELEYDVLTAVRADLSENVLYDEGGLGRYRGIILTEGGLGYQDGGEWKSALEPEEWARLWEYQRLLDVPQATYYLYPSDFPEDYGLSLVAIRDTGRFPSSLTPTERGRTLLATSSLETYFGSGLPVQDAYMYLATESGDGSSRVTPLLVSESGNVVAALSVSEDGRERLVFTVAQGAGLLHSEVLADTLVEWVATAGGLAGLSPVERGVRFLDINRVGLLLTALVILFAFILALLQRRRAAAQTLRRYNVQPGDTRRARRDGPRSVYEVRSKR